MADYPELANTLYDSFLGQRGDISYNSAPNVEYPTKDQISTFGTVYLPRVYGLDLTAFEIASSGSVAFTLNDVHSLDMTRNNAASNITLSTLCNDNLVLNAGTTSYTINTTSDTHHFSVNGTDVVVIDQDNLRVTGNLVLTGVIDAQNIVESSLVVEDKIIYLASTSSNLDWAEMQDDGTVNNGAGIYIAGIPGSLTNPVAGSNYEKSIRWNYGTDGTMSLGTSNIDSEAFWDVKGGALKLTHVKTDSNGNYLDNVAFRFRINERDELELVKHYTSSNNARVSKRIARFGLTQVNL